MGEKPPTIGEYVDKRKTETVVLCHSNRGYMVVDTLADNKMDMFLTIQIPVCRAGQVGI